MNMLKIWWLVYSSGKTQNLKLEMIGPSASVNWCEKRNNGASNIDVSVSQSVRPSVSDSLSASQSISLSAGLTVCESQFCQSVSLRLFVSLS